MLIVFFKHPTKTHVLESINQLMKLNKHCHSVDLTFTSRKEKIIKKKNDDLVTLLYETSSFKQYPIRNHCVFSCDTL